MGVLLTVVVIFGLLPAVSARAEDKGVIVFSTESPDGTLTQAEVDEQLADADMGLNDTFIANFGETVLSIGISAFRWCGNLISVVIPDNVICIGEQSFLGCTRLMSVDIGSGVTSIGAYAFYGCEYLPSIVIPDSVTSLHGGAFARCIELTEINIDPNNDSYSSDDGVVLSKDRTTLVIYPGGKPGGYDIPNSVTNIGSFAYCYTNITSFSVPDGITDIGASAFARSDLATIDFGNSVNNIGSSAFESCSNLTDIVIPDSVENIESGAFYACTSLRSIVLGKKATTLGGGNGRSVFFGCTSLTSIVLSDGLPIIGAYAFSDCVSLLDISIPDSVTSIGTYAFYGCTSLTDIDIPDSVTTIGENAFRQCSSLLSVAIPDSVTHIGFGAFCDCSSLVSIVIPDSMTSISDGTFAWCSSLTSIVIPNSVTSIGRQAFFGCSSLASVVIPDSVTSISDGTFAWCSSLTSIVIPDSVTTIGSGAFSLCTSLVSIDIPEGVTTIGSNAFNSCTSLTNVVIPNNVTSIDQAVFLNCSNLTSIVIPDSVRSILYRAFIDCSSLTDIVIPSSVTHITYDVFNGTKIKTITLSSPELTFEFSSSGAGAFSDMPALENIVFVTGVTAISANAFQGISAPVKVFIPKSVETIHPLSRLGANTTMYVFANSYAEKYAKENNIPFEYIPTVIADELPMGYQFLPYSFSFASSDDSWLEVVKGELPKGLRISTEQIDKRSTGEIWGAPLEAGLFKVTVKATNGNNNFLEDDEITFEIYIEPDQTQVWMDQLRDDLIEWHLGTYDETEKIWIVDIYDTDPEDVTIKFGCGFGDFIDLWIDGVQMKRDLEGNRDGDYYAEEGSTIITLYGKTLGKLDPTINHIIAAEFKKGGEADGEQYKVAQNFRIKKVSRPNTRGAADLSNDSGSTIPISTNTPNTFTPPITLPPTEQPPAIEQPPNTEPLPPTAPVAPIVIPTPTEQPRRTTITINADVILDATGTIAYATVSDDEVTAAAEEVVLAAAQENAQSEIETLIDVPADITSFELALSDTSVNALTEYGVDALTISCPRLGTMAMAKSTLAAMDNTRNGQEVEIALRHLVDPAQTMTARQRATAGGDSAVEITILAGGNYLTDLGGTLQVDLPYTLKPGQRAEDIYVYYLAEDGRTEIMPSKYKDSEGVVTFDTTHLSVYAIGHSAEAASAAAGGSPAMPYTSGADLTLWITMLGALLALSGFALKRRKGCAKLQ